MIRTISVCERNIIPDPPRVITLAAATPTIIFQDMTYDKTEIVTRYIQNNTGGTVFLSFGVLATDGSAVCDNTGLYHAFILNAQLFECFPHRKCICAYSVSGGPVSTTILRRIDLSN